MARNPFVITRSFVNEDGHHLALGVPAGAELDGYNDQLFRPSYTWEDGYSEAFLGVRDDGAVRVLNTRTDQFGGLVDLTLTTDTGQQATLDLSLALGEIGGFGGGNLGVASLRSARSTSGMRAWSLHGGRAKASGLGGLETRGVHPAPGTRVIPEGIPDGWRIRPTDTKGGVRYFNPKNPNEEVRVMQGKPGSPYPNSQAPYARQRNTAGTYLREDGTLSPLPRGGLRDEDAHIPLDKFKVRK